jgi:hypothetical protein
LAFPVVLGKQLELDEVIWAENILSSLQPAAEDGTAVVDSFPPKVADASVEWLLMKHDFE